MAWYNFGRGSRGGDSIHAGQQTTYPNIPTEVRDFDTAMTQSAFWACIRLLSETVASMPLVPYSTDLESGIKERDFDNKLWELLNYKPNRYQTKIEFFEQIMLNLTCWGNSYVTIERASSGRIVSLMPYPASQVLTVLQDDGSVIYQYTDLKGNVKIFSQKSMWHVKLFGNGIIGLSPLQYAGNALGLSKNLSDRQNTLAANGGKTNGILTVDQALKPEQKESVRKSFAGLQAGNADELFVLEAGFNYQQASLSPTDMQLLESRRFSIEDIARFIGPPSTLINDTSSTTTWGSGIEQINMGFYKLTLRPYLERLESSIKVHLMPQKDWRTVDIEFNFDQLLRADAATRAESNSKRINSGQNTPNEIRASEGDAPMSGGDVLLVNSALIPVDQTGQQGIANE